ncbi:type II toxin-antitoxin system VapC family toxin [Rhodoferax sp.]|uniref:type II toxin-antitoxin system VapC family toxin n=1 Tax=Rhodoferax sp. TaxID=50421 RepID=UPI002772701C|nr:PIN domain-containing protein [Rhodoferax sp.]
MTLAELLVKPLQSNDAIAVAAVRELLVADGAITLVSHSRRCFERAADLRARHGLKTLQLATAVEAGARCLVSNDRQFPQISGIECVSLD